ncbi:MAG: cupin domain-containing protein [Desulfobacter sp.]
MHNPTKCFLCSDFGKTTENGVEKQTVFWGDARKAFKGSQELFTGDVQLSLLFPPNKTAQYSGAHGTFQPGARTAWHIHPAGQYMIVTSGVGRTGTRDGKILEIKAGDVIWCPPDTEHWHGASPDAPMALLLITGVFEYKNVVYKEKVTDKQYLGK